MSTLNNRYRVKILTADASHGPSRIAGIIDDAQDIGVSDYANEVGEAFFTLPSHHPLLGQIDPLESHYQIERFAPDGTYDTMGVGLIEDYEADRDEIVFFGHDYKGVLDTSITASTTTYTSQLLGNMVSAQLSSAISATNSRLAFTSLGSIDATTTTATLITAFESRLGFIRGIAEVSMADRSVRSILTISRESPYQWTFEENRGQDRERLRLEYGGLVTDFRYSPGFRQFATRIKGIGIKRDGAAVLYSDQSYASEATYGRIERPEVFQDVTDQAALDARTKRAARRAGSTERNVFIRIRAGVIVPWSGYDIGDSIRVVISRGSKVSVNGLYTLWGQEWTVSPDGREDLFMALSVKET